jgi:hypothetical protein
MLYGAPEVPRQEREPVGRVIHRQLIYRNVVDNGKHFIAGVTPAIKTKLKISQRIFLKIRNGPRDGGN